MNQITTQYLDRAEVFLLITMLAYFLMNGAQLFETAVLVPKWTAKPPASLSVLQGPFAPDLKTFWIIAHTIHELTFLAAIVFCWRLPEVRYSLLVIFAAHFAVRMWTLGCFAPAIMGFQKVNSGIISLKLAADVIRWRNQNYLRVAAFIGLSVGVAVLFSKVQSIQSVNIANKHQIMEQRLSVITLGVDDLPAQKNFYITKLGWQPVAANKDIVFFKLNGFLFSLFNRKALAELSGVAAEGSGFRSLTLSYNVSQKEEVDKLYMEFKNKGIAILKAPSPTPFGGYYFIFSDPEQNVLEISYNPYIPLDAKGDVITHKNIDQL